jgi:hypothetical protein
MDKEIRILSIFQFKNSEAFQIQFHIMSKGIDELMKFKPNVKTFKLRVTHIGFTKLKFHRTL